MPTYLHHLEAAVPGVVYEQESVRGVLAEWLGADRRMERLLERVVASSGIETRHAVVPDMLPGAPPGLYRSEKGFRRPGTGERMERYAQEAERLFTCLGKRALERCPGVGPEDVTHVVTVSCTGFYAPGPDVQVARALGLRPGVQRTHVGFMGCYAAFPALRLAHAFCAADPDAVVLVLLVELCSLHFDPEPNLDSLRATTVFADGGAAAVVSARPPAEGARALELRRFAGGLTPGGEEEMTWKIGDHGFRMTLSSYVPTLIGENLEAMLDPLWADLGVDREEVGRWAVHPGGRAILDRVERDLALPPEALGASREVLRRFGNMSSATVLFVLAEELERGVAPGEPLLAAAFGPGLTVEAATLVGAGG